MPHCASNKLEAVNIDFGASKTNAHNLLRWKYLSSII